MLQLLETGKALYVLAAICGLGVLTRLITGRLYKRLLKESTNLAMTKNKSLKELRQRAENTYRMNQGLRDSGVWLEHQLAEFRYMGITLSGWNTLSMQWVWLCLLAGAVGSFASYWYRLDTLFIVLYGGGAVMLAMVMMLFDLGAVGGKKEQLLFALQDYMENVMCPRLARNLSADGGRDGVDGNRRNRIYPQRRQTSGSFAGYGQAETDEADLRQTAIESAGAGSGDERLAQRDRRFAADTGGSDVSAEMDGGLSADSVVNGGKNGRKLSGRAARRAAAAARAEAARLENEKNNARRLACQETALSENLAVVPAGGTGGISDSAGKISPGEDGGRIREGRRGIEKAESKSETEYLRHSLEQIAASREKARAADENWLKDLGPEEVQLIGDIIKQYLG